MISVPWKSNSFHKKTMSLTELIDLAPTLSSLAGIENLPGAEGKDLSSLFDDPSLSLKEFTFHQYPVCVPEDISPEQMSFDHERFECNKVPKNQFWGMGYTIRSSKYRYTRWLRWDQTNLKAKWDTDNYTEELYLHGETLEEEENLDLSEIENIAKENPYIVKTLYTELRKQFYDDDDNDDYNIYSVI